MLKLKRLLALLMISVYLIVIGAVPAQATAVPAGFDSWSLQATTDTKKVWTVNFTLPVDPSTVNNSRFYITDDNNQAVKTTLVQSSDGTSVKVNPTKAYTVGAKYWLFIAGGLTANSGKNTLTQPIAVPFIVAAENSKIIQVSGAYSSLLTSFTVVTSPDVYKVKVNQKELLYQGNNTFSLGMTGLKTGSIVTVYAYNSSGKLLESQKYTIN